MAKSKAKPELIRTIEGDGHRVHVYSIRKYQGSAYCTKCPWDAPVHERYEDAISAARVHCGLSPQEPQTEDSSNESTGIRSML